VAKNREDFSDNELREFHEELSKAKTKEDRAAIYKRIGVNAQAIGQWFRRMKLAPLGPISGTGEPKKRGRPAGSKTKTKAKGKGAAKKKAGKGPGRPKGKAKPASAGKGRPKGRKAGTGKAAKKASRPARRGGGLGLSREAKETAIRLLSLLLEG